LEFLHLNDNKLTKLPDQIGNCSKMKSLLLHNNKIYSLPVTIYKFIHLHELGLDWLMYLHSDAVQGPNDRDYGCK